MAKHTIQVQRKSKIMYKYEKKSGKCTNDLDPFFPYGQRSDIPKALNKWVCKCIQGIYKGAKRPDRAERGTQKIFQRHENNSFSLLKAQLTNEFHHGH